MSRYDVVLFGFPGFEDMTKENEAKPVYRPRAKQVRPDTPLYVDLNTAEIPDLRKRFDEFLREKGLTGAEYVRWLISYAMAKNLIPDWHNES